MKCFLLITTILFSSGLWAARDRQILKCLGEEERQFHLNKETGPVYDLNQRLIAEMVQIPNVELTDVDYLAICTGKNFSKSWKLLELSITKGKEIFVIPLKVSGMQKEMTKGMVDDYVESTREILINFITQIQAASPTVNCLKDEIPELDNFFKEVKYLQEDVDLKIIFKGKDQKVFERLKNYPLAFEKCRSLLNKKKARPVSTPAAKNS